MKNHQQENLKLILLLWQEDKLFLKQDLINLLLNKNNLSNTIKNLIWKWSHKVIFQTTDKFIKYLRATNKDF